MADAATQKNSLAYVSSEPAELDKFVKLKQGANGSITKNVEKITKLEQLLTNAGEVLQGLDLGNINTRVDAILTKLGELQNTNYEVSNNMLLNFVNYTAINDSLGRIAVQINANPQIQIQLVNLPNVVRNIRNLAQQAQQILFKFIVLQPKESGWQHIKNTVQIPAGAAAEKPNINSKLHSKTSINNATNIENSNVSNTEPINTYLDECEKHQHAYIAKHNEIKKLFDHLKRIIEIIKLILDVIRTLSQVKSIQKRRRIGALPSVKIPKALLQELEQYRQDQKTILDKSNTIIASAESAENASKKATGQMNGGFFQLGGAAAAAAMSNPAQQQPKIILSQDTIQVPVELAEALNPGDIIEINIKGQQQLVFSIKINKRQQQNQNTFSITITPQIDNLDAFNELTYQQQQAAMNIVRLGIDHSGFLSVAGYLEQMMRNSFIEFDRQLDRLKGVQINQATESRNNTDPNIPFDEEHQSQIQNILYNCYDLQILYLIKHVEVVNLFKFILFHYDVLLNNLAILINLLKLFDVLEINIETILGNVNVRKVIQNMQNLVAEQSNAMQSIFRQPTQAGGAAAAPTGTGINDKIKSQLPQDLLQERQIDSYIKAIKEALDTDITYEDEKLSALEKSIGDAIIRISKEQQPNPENKDKLYKAYRAIRILRLRKLEVNKEWATAELKNLAHKQIKELKKHVDSDDLFSAIERMKGQDDILTGVYSQYATKQLDESQFTNAPVEGQTRELQQILDNYYKTRNPQVCKVGDPNSCSTQEVDIKTAKELINKVFQDVFSVEIQDDILNNLKLPTTFKLFQLADFLYDKYKKKEELKYEVIAQWLNQNGYNDLHSIINNAETVRRESEAQQAKSAEEQERLNAEKLVKNKSIIAEFANIARKLFNEQITQETANTIKKEYNDAFEEIINYLKLEKTNTIKNLSECLISNMSDDNINTLGEELQSENYNNLLINLRELFLQACSTVIKIRSSDENQSQSAGGVIPDIQIGGYKWQDVINVKPDGLTLSVGDLCNEENINSGNSNVYGPFKAIYTPGINQMEIYNNIFGNHVVNKAEPQNLLGQLQKGKNVIIFGFGFSGSGKTYTLIEMGHPEEEQSLLEMFISKQKDKIKSVEFQEIYPKNKKLFTANTEGIDEYKSLNASDIANLGKKIKEIEMYRRKHLTICATPNNDNSSRSFLQITLNLEFGKGTDSDAAAANPNKITSKLVFFDMPGTENTARIRSQFFGEKAFIKGDDCNNSIKYKTGLPLVEGILSAFDAMFKVCKNGENITHLVLKTLKQKTKEQAKSNADNYYSKTLNTNSLFEDTIIQKLFKEAIIKINSAKNFITSTENKVGNYIISVSEAATLFFNGRTEKSIREFIESNYKHEKDIILQILDEKTIDYVVNNFLSKFIYKKGNTRQYAYFELPKATAPAKTAPKSILLTDLDKKNIKEIFGISIDVDVNCIKLNDFNADKLKFYNYNTIENSFEDTEIFVKDIEFKDESRNEHPMIKYFMILFSFIKSKKKMQQTKKKYYSYSFINL